MSPCSIVSKTLLHYLTISRLVPSLQSPKQLIPHSYSSQWKVRKATDLTFPFSCWLELNHIHSSKQAQLSSLVQPKNSIMMEEKENKREGTTLYLLYPTQQIFLIDADLCVLYLYNILVYFLRRRILQLE